VYTISAAESRWLTSRSRTNAARVRIRNSSGEWVDYGELHGRSWLDSVTLEESVDVPVMAATVTLKAQAFHRFLSPLMSLNNQLAGHLANGREIEISLAVVPDGDDASSAYKVMFVGRIDRWSMVGRDLIEISARESISRLLQDRWIEDETAYSTASGSPVQTIMQQILNEWADSTVLTTPVSPEWMIREFKRKGPVIDALRDLAMQIGWDVRVFRTADTSSAQLRFYEPDRSAGSTVRGFSADDYFSIDSLTEGLEDIRNVVVVWYSDRLDPDVGGVPRRKKVTATDAASVAKYGRRWMEIAEASTSNIDTATEATALANACLSDLATAESSHVVAMPLFWAVQLHDKYLFEANDVHYSSNMELSVMGYRHEVTADRAVTTLTMTGKAVAGRLRWIARDARAGIAAAARQIGPLDLPIPLAIPAALSGILQAPRPIDLRWMDTEFHLGDVPDFTPSESTLVNISRSNSLSLPGLDPGVTRHFRAVHRDIAGNRSQPTESVSFTPGYVLTTHLEPSLQQAVLMAHRAMTKSANQTFSNTIFSQPVSFNVTLRNYGGLITASTSGDKTSLTVSQAGLYNLNAILVCQPNNNTDLMKMAAVITSDHGAYRIEGQEVTLPANKGQMTLSFNATVPMQPGDSVHLEVAHTGSYSGSEILIIGGVDSRIELSKTFGSIGERYLFTNAGATGRFGPSQAQLNTAYAGTNLDETVTSLSGKQRWVVPATGSYRVTCVGAQGATGSSAGRGGYGAILSGIYTFFAGDQLDLVVGQMGSGGGTLTPAGGGGSYLVRTAPSVVDVMIAGGGGGFAVGSTSINQGLADANFAFANGKDGFGGTSFGTGGTDGNGGNGASTRGAGGAGRFTNGGDGSFAGSGGRSYSNGSDGGNGLTIASGGFGGGGAVDQTTGFGACGGGGGSGGGGGGYASSAAAEAAGGGGGSKASVTVTDLRRALNQGGGHGRIVIERLF
jgi:hypothetical protein